MIGNNITRQTDAMPVATLFKFGQRGVTTEIIGNTISVQGVGGSLRFRVAAKLFDFAGSMRTFPDAYQPEGIKALPGQAGQLFLRDVCKAGNLSLIAVAELIKPDVN